MRPDQNMLDVPHSGAVAPRRFDPRTAAPFVNKSVSEETRRAYRRAVADFFQFVGGKDPAQVVAADVLAWRDYLRSRRRRAATVSFKLSVIRSFFEYLRAGGFITLTHYTHRNTVEWIRRVSRDSIDLLKPRLSNAGNKWFTSCASAV